MRLEANSESEDKIACSVTYSGELLQSMIGGVISVVLIVTAAVGMLTLFGLQISNRVAYSIGIYLSAWDPAK